VLLIIVWWFGGGLEAMPHTNVEVNARQVSAYFYRSDKCTYKLAHDEYFNLWDTS